jgi:glycosyltransferase involved in cell wall biosynthesis
MSARCRRAVALVLPYLKARGTELQALQLVQGLKRLGWRCSVIVTQGWGDADVIAAFADAAADLQLLQPPLCPGLKRVHRRRVFGLRRALARSGCSVVLSRAGMTNMIAGLAAGSLGLPSVAVLSTAVTSPDPASRRCVPPRAWAEVLWRLRRGWPSRFVCVSRQSLRNLQAAYPGLEAISTVIVNGVGTGPLLPDRDTTPALPGFDGAHLHLCSVGSLECGRKGLDLLIQAMALLRRPAPRPLLLTLIGTGPDEQRLQAMVAELELGPHVRFAGEIRHPQQLVRQADLFVLPSRREGLPNALLEAMAVGTCALAADCPTGPAEVIRHGETGWLVPAGSAEALAEAMAFLLDRPELRRRLAEAGQQSVLAEFGTERCAAAYDRLLTGLIERA